MVSLFGKSKEEERKERKDGKLQEIQELLDEELDAVNGAGNPFDEVPRIPTQPIDSDLRKKG